MQGFFSAGNLQKLMIFTIFCPKLQFSNVCSIIFDAVDVKLKTPVDTRFCVYRRSMITTDPDIVFAQMFPKFFRHFSQILFTVIPGGSGNLPAAPTRHPDYGQPPYPLPGNPAAVRPFQTAPFSPAGASGLFLPSSLSRCSCMAAAEAERNRTRDCFTSSRAA